MERHTGEASGLSYIGWTCDPCAFFEIVEPRESRFALRSRPLNSLAKAGSISKVSPCSCGKGNTIAPDNRLKPR
jgi:hypothetical protein